MDGGKQAKIDFKHSFELQFLKGAIVKHSKLFNRHPLVVPTCAWWVWSVIGKVGLVVVFSEVCGVCQN